VTPPLGIVVLIFGRALADRLQTHLPRDHLMKLIPLLGLLAVAACADFGPEDELSAARERWDSRGPASYDVTIQRECECLPEVWEPVTVHVINGTIVSRTPASGAAASPFFTDVPGLFDQIAQAISAGHLASVEYDFTTGFPRHFLIDPDGPDIVDGEMGIRSTLRR
jgi:hypothetical protein